MSCSSTTRPTSCRPEERLLFPVEVSLEQLLQSVKDTIEDYLQKEKLPFPTSPDKSPVKDEGFVSKEVGKVLLP